MSPDQRKPGPATCVLSLCILAPSHAPRASPRSVMTAQPAPQASPAPPATALPRALLRVALGVISRGPCRPSGQLGVSGQEAQGAGSGRREHGSGQACLPSPTAPHPTRRAGQRRPAGSTQRPDLSEHRSSLLPPSFSFWVQSLQPGPWGWEVGAPWQLPAGSSLLPTQPPPPPPGLVSSERRLLSPLTGFVSFSLCV